MKSVNTHDAKTRLSVILAEVEQNAESFVICRNGKPVADLVPHRGGRRSSPHPVMSRKYGIEIVT